MERNVGKLDAGLRWLLAAFFFTLSLVANHNQAVALLAAVAAVVMVATTLTRMCPLYWLFGFNTCPRNLVAPRGSAENPLSREKQ